MEKVLKSILATEAKAEKIVNDARDKARVIAEDTEKETARISGEYSEKRSAKIKKIMEEADSVRQAACGDIIERSHTYAKLLEDKISGRYKLAVQMCLNTLLGK